MSAGAFETVAYETSTPSLGGFVMRARVQPETLALTIGGVANAGSANPIDLPLFVNISGSNSSLGVKPRKVVIEFTDDSNIPDGYTGENLTLPVLTVAAATAYTDGATGTYLGSPVAVVSSLPERSR